MLQGLIRIATLRLYYAATIADDFVKKKKILIWISASHFNYIYSWLSLSRSRLSQITAYLEVKIWSLFKRENLITGNKILWNRGEITPKEQFLLFSTIFSIHFVYLTSGVKLYTHLWNVVVRIIFSSILQIWYVEVRISRSISEGPLDFEITGVDCMLQGLIRIATLRLYYTTT